MSYQLKKWNRLKKKIDQKIATNAKDIHAIGVGVSVVMLTTVTDFFARHFIGSGSGEHAGNMIYIALALTLTSRIIGVILRKLASSTDETKERKTKRKIRKRRKK